jgi:hypothetical protein
MAGRYADLKKMPRKVLLYMINIDGEGKIPDKI